MVTETELSSMTKVYDHINAFYKNIVSKGRDDLHAGIFRTPEDDGNTISRQAIEELAALAISVGARFDPGATVVDLGSGLGGSAHKLAADYGCKVTCVNILPSQNAINRTRVQELGLDHLVSVVDGSFDSLPPEWSGKFDVVWSMDAFMHGPDKRAIVAEAFRVIKPGGVFIFSDIMAGPYAFEKNIDIYRARYNIKHEMFTVARYEEVLEEAGFVVLRTRDFTAHLVPFLRGAYKDAMRLWDTFPEDERPFFDSYIQSYRQSVESLVESEGQAWSALVCVKPKSGEADKYRKLSGKIN